ncbi:hypothetical protein [Thaumasiovibrio subtropicus]|uniref:hypothetical protein n=1 Tax=Thaumasiovibrio subtropicus TaxID=1891207 RepID=UPI000B3597CB|nr:hypothetical protein [Thaumasiovibrio subtropicus]
MTKEAMIAVYHDGFVECACLCDDNNADAWRQEMIASGYTILVVSKEKMNTLIFTVLPEGTY